MNKSIKIAIGILAGILILKLLCGLALIAISIWYLGVSRPVAVRYFKTISELHDRQEEMIGKPQRISGVVLGDSILYDPVEGVLTFTIAEVPADYQDVERQGGLDIVLENVVNNPNLPKIQVIYFGEKPKLLRHKAQAIIVGHLDFDGMFYADEILLKCPTRYKDALPDQVID